MSSWHFDDRRRVSGPQDVGGILPLRVAAYLIDLCLIGIMSSVLWVGVHILIVLSLGLLAFLAGPLPFIAILYHTLCVGSGAGGTLGMRLMGIRVIGRDGSRPTYAQAGVQALLFYASVAVSHFLVLLVPLLDGRRRMLHDMASGLVLVRLCGSRSFA